MIANAWITAPPPPHSTPAPASHNTPRRPSPAPPASGRPPSSPRRRRTGRSPPSPVQTSGGRGPPAAAAPLPAALPSSGSRSRDISPAPFHGRRRPAAADVVGFVLYLREGDIVGGADVGSVGSTFAAGAANGCGQMWPRIHDIAHKRAFHRFVCSSAENRGTPAVTRRFVVHALRSLILLYIRVHRSIIIGIRGVFPDFLLASVVFSFAATATNLLQPAAIAATVGVVIQTDGGSPAPGPVDLAVSRSRT